MSNRLGHTLFGCGRTGPRPGLNPAAAGCLADIVCRQTHDAGRYPMSILEAKILLLIVAANGAPILARWLLGSRLAWPVDAGRRAADGRPWFGPHKTWRGLIAAGMFGAGLGWLLGPGPGAGLLLASLAMGGDLLASFTKRRLGMVAGSPAPLLDQLPEVLLPLLGWQALYELDWPALLRLCLLFIALDYLLSRLLYRLHIRHRPY